MNWFLDRGVMEFGLTLLGSLELDIFDATNGRVQQINTHCKQSKIKAKFVLFYDLYV